MLHQELAHIKSLASDLNFKGHHKVVNKSLSYKSHLLTRLRTKLTLDAAIDTVKTMVLPIVDYGQLIYMELATKQV